MIATITPPTLEPSRTRSRRRPRWSARAARLSPRPRATPPRRPPRRPTRTRAEALQLHTGRLAGRRARQPRPGLRRQSAQRRLPRGRGARLPLGPAAAQEEVRGRAHGGPDRPGRPAGRRAAPPDLHERVRPLDRAGPRRVQARPRPDPRDPRRDRPSVRRGARPPRRRAGRPQRPQVAAAGARGADFHRVRVGVGRPDSTDPDLVAAYVLGRWRQPAGEVAALVERASDEAERLILGG